jgi:hypothetical protein
VVYVASWKYLQVIKGKTETVGFAKSVYLGKNTISRRNVSHKYMKILSFSALFDRKAAAADNS